MTVPKEYLPVMPYLIIKDAYKFINFMKAAFNAEVQYLHERSEGVIMHAELKIEQAIIMLADATAEYLPFPGSVFMYVENADTIIEKALSMGAASLQEIADRPYGRGGGFKDDFGNHWWVNTPLEKQQ